MIRNLTLAPPSAACRLCGATIGQRRIGREAKAGLGQWLMRCAGCAGLYLDPDLSSASQFAFYRDHYRRLYPFEASARIDEDFLFGVRAREFGLRRARVLGRGLPQGGTVLELGSGHGAFLGRLHALRPDLALWAIEPDGRHRHAALDGAPVAFVEAVEAAAAHGPFDLIVLFHTLEHLIDPIGTLRRLGSMLAPSGRVIIEVPVAFPPGSTWSEVHPAHTTCFTAAALERSLGMAGLMPLPQVGSAARLGDSLWQEARRGAGSVAPAPIAEIAAVDAAVDAASARRGGWVWRRVLAGIGANLLGRLSRWKQAPALDDSLAEPDGRRFRMGVGLDVLPLAELVARAIAAMAEHRPLRQADLNVAKLIDMRADSRFRMAVASADIVSPDGMGVVWACRLLGLLIAERVSGIDLLEALMAACAEHGFRPFFLGGRADVLERALAELQRRHPRLELAGAHHGYFAPDEEVGIVARIRASKADCLIAALPSPRQDLFLACAHPASNVPFAMGVGGSLDVLAGDRVRAPMVWRRAGLEWLFRMAQEPRRLGPRYLRTNARFAVALVLDWVARRLRD